jgi:hypothetical protein
MQLVPLHQGGAGDEVLRRHRRRAHRRGDPAVWFPGVRAAARGGALHVESC